MFRAALKTRTGAIAAVMLAVLLLMAVFGPLLAPYDPLGQNVAHLLAGPSAAHPLGTDYLGRDVLSRLLAGALRDARALVAHAQHRARIHAVQRHTEVGFTVRDAAAVIDDDDAV